MATTMHLRGVRTPHSAFSRRHLHGQLIPSLNRVHFTISGALGSGLCGRTVESCCRSRVLRVSCEKRSVDVLEWSKTENQSCDGVLNQLTCVMKFGGSSVASAERMREVADLIRSFPEERPVIVLSAMGKTTNKLILVLLLTNTLIFYFNLVIQQMPTEIGCVLGWGKGCQLWYF